MFCKKADLFVPGRNKDYDKRVKEFEEKYKEVLGKLDRRNNPPPVPKSTPIDWTTLALMAGSGLLSHTVAKSVLENDDSEEKKKSALRRALPLAIGALGAYGGYLAGNAVKTAGTDDKSIREIDELYHESVDKEKHDRGLAKGWRYGSLLSGGASLAGLYNWLRGKYAVPAMNNLIDARNALKTTPAGSEWAKQNESVKRLTEAAPKRKPWSVGINPKGDRYFLRTWPKWVTGLGTAAALFSGRQASSYQQQADEAKKNADRQKYSLNELRRQSGMDPIE